MSAAGGCRGAAGRGERALLLESLRQRIARGEYLVPSEDVAAAVLLAWARPGPGGTGPTGSWREGRPAE